MEKLLKNSAVYGLILGGITVLFSMTVFLADVYMLSIGFGIFNFIFSITLISLMLFLGTKAYREKHSEGYIKYGKALLSCLLIGFFAAVISAIYTFIFFKTVDPAYFEAMISKFMASLEAKQVPADQMDKIYEKMSEGFHKPAIIQALQSLLATTITSGIIGLIVSAVVKKERPLFE